MIVRSLTRLSRTIKSASSQAMKMGFAGDYQRSNQNGENMSFNRISQNANYGDRMYANRTLTEFIETLKYATTSLDLATALKIMRNSLNVIKTREDAMTLKSDPNFIKVVELFKNHFQTMNELEVSEALFILRKANKALNFGIIQNETQPLRKRMNDLVEQKTFNMKSLTNLYFNCAVLAWPVDRIVRMMSSMVEENMTELNVQNVPQLITAAAIRRQPLSSLEYKLVEIICRSADLYYNQLDYRRKSDLFKNLAKLELHINTNKQNYPQIINKLRKDFKENIEKLGEEEVLNIIEAYSYLSKSFNNDLIDEFRRMVEITLEQNSSNLQSIFLMKYLEAQVSLLRRMSPQGLQRIIDTLAARFSQKESATLDSIKIVRLCFKLNIRNNNLCNAISNHLAEKTASEISSNWILVEYLIRNQMDISNLVDKVTQPDVLTKFGTTKLYILRSGMKEVKGNPYAAQIKAIESQPTYSNILSLSSFFAQSPYGSVDSDVLVEYVTQLLQYTGSNAEKQDVFTKDFFDKLLGFCQNYKVSFLILKNDSLSLKNLSQYKLNLLISKLFLIQDVNIYQVRLVMGILSLNKDQIPRNRLLSLFISNRVILREVCNKDKSLINEIIKLLKTSSAMIQDSEELNYEENKLGRLDREPNIQDIYRLVKRFEDITDSHDSLDDILRFYLKKSTQCTFYDMQAASHLATKGSLPSEIGAQVLAKFGSMNTTDYTYPIACRLLGSSHVTTELVELAKGVTDRHLARLDKESQEVEQKNAIKLIAEYLQLPISYLKDRQEKLLSMMKENIEHSTSRTYFNTIDAFPKRIMKYNLDFYLPFLKLLASHYTKVRVNIKPHQLIHLLEFFANCNLRSPTLYNFMLQDLGRAFNSLKSSDLVILIDAFSKLHYNQPDLIDKSLEEIIKDGFNRLSRSEIETLFKALFRLGYSSKVIIDNLNELLRLRSVKPSVQVQAVPYILSLQLPNEEDILKDIFFDLKEVPERSSSYLNDVNRKKINILIGNLLEDKYKDKDFAKTWRKITKEDGERKPSEEVEDMTAEIEKSKEAPSKEIRKVDIDVIKPYLDLMEVTYTEAPDLGVPSTYFLLPQNNIIVHLLKKEAYNFDKMTLRGYFIIMEQALKHFAGDKYKIISVNGAHFLSLNDHQSRLSYLVSCGIDSANASKSLDFSKLDKLNRPDRRRAPEQTDAEEDMLKAPESVESTPETPEKTT